MNCNGSQGIIQKLHDANERDSVGEIHMNLALEHLSTCGQCKSWFTQNMCPKMHNESDEDTYMMHGMMHEPLGSECPYF